MPAKYTCIAIEKELLTELSNITKTGTGLV